MRVCLYSCVRACVFVCVCVCNVYSVRVYKSEYALMYANLCVCTYKRVCVFLFLYLHMNSERECMYTYMLVKTYMCAGE